MQRYYDLLGSEAKCHNHVCSFQLTVGSSIANITFLSKAQSQPPVRADRAVPLQDIIEHLRHQPRPGAGCTRGEPLDNNQKFIYHGSCLGHFSGLRHIILHRSLTGAVDVYKSRDGTTDEDALLLDVMEDLGDISEDLSKSNPGEDQAVERIKRMPSPCVDMLRKVKTMGRRTAWRSIKMAWASMRAPRRGAEAQE
jgi:hypothetical protein